MNNHPARPNKNPDFDLAVDVGTSPHGLSADLPVSHQETREGLRDLPPASQQALKAARMPEVYRSPEVLKSCAGIHAAAVKQKRERHRLELTDCEFLHVYFDCERDRNATRRDIKKGLASAGDLKATDSLWHKLESIMTARMPGVLKDYALIKRNAKGGNTWRNQMRSDCDQFEQEDEL